jgi:hypothetical protein
MTHLLNLLYFITCLLCLLYLQAPLLGDFIKYVLPLMSAGYQLAMVGCMCRTCSPFLVVSAPRRSQPRLIMQFCTGLDTACFKLDCSVTQAIHHQYNHVHQAVQYHMYDTPDTRHLSLGCLSSLMMVATAKQEC